MEDRDAPDGGEVRGQVFERLLNFLNRLDEARIYYTLGHTRPESVMVDISLPSHRYASDGAGQDLEPVAR